MARPSIREVSAPENIIGVAAPVNTYVRPADPARSSLHDLAEGLAGFDSGLSSFLDERKKETAESDAARAVADFHRNNQVGFAEGVRQGVIPATASKYYVESYKRQQGNLQGLKLSDKFAIDYQQWGGRSKGDPAEYSAWQAQWFKENVGQEQDPYVLGGLAPHLDQIAGRGYATFNKDRDETLRSNAKATSGALLTDSMRRNQADNTATGQVNYDQFWKDAMTIREEAIKRGDKSEDIDAAIAESIILSAEEKNDLETLKLLDRKLPGMANPMSYDLNVRDAKFQSEARIRSRQGVLASDIAQAEERKDKQQHNEWLGEATMLLAQGKEVPEEMIRNLSRRNGKIRHELQQMRESFEGAEQEEDQQSLMAIYSDIDEGRADAASIINMSKRGVIRKASTFKEMMDRVKSVREAYNSGGVFQSPTYKDTVKFITNATGTGETSWLTNERGLTSEGMEALFDYRRLMLDWSARNPDASLLEREKAAREAGDIIRSRLTPTSPGSLQQDYVSDEDRRKTDSAYISEADHAKRAPLEPQEPPPPQREEGLLPYLDHNVFGGYFARNLFGGDTPSTAPQAPAQAAPTAPQSAPPVAPPAQQAPTQPRAEVPALESLPANRRQAVEALAARKGITPEEANRIVHENMERIRQQQPQTPPAGEGTTPSTLGPRGDISPETRSKLTALFKDPPKVRRLADANVPVAPLLNLIGGAEGTDRGAGYNETLSYGAYTGGPVNLVGMTLDQIDELQSQMLVHPDNSLNSSAVGRYQIIRTTMRSLRQELGLSGSEVFNEGLQDRLAVHLLERRGLSRWQSGQMSDEQFMAGLSSEWASLPKADGRPTYNQGLGTNVGSVKGTLGKVRVASLDPSAGMSSLKADPYGNLPDAEREQFREWNSDPVGNEETNLQSVDPTLANVVRRAKELSGVPFVLGSGRRTPEQQKKALEWGWSKTEHSDHLDGSSVDLWPLDESGSVVFEPARQKQIMKAMKQAAKELGVTLDVGGDWKSFKDLPHFAIKR